MAQTGYTPISLYYTTTASAVPTSGNLVNGELALNINTADGKLFYKDSAGVVQVLASKGAGTVGGANTQVQYNNNGALAGSANFVWDNANTCLGLGTSSPSTALQLGGAYNKTIRLDSATGNAAFFGNFNTYTIMASNRNPNTGVFVDTGKASGSISIDANTGVSNITFNTTASNNTEPTERMRITSAGLVGINTITPSFNLEVVSNISATATASEATVHVKNSLSDVYLFNSYTSNTVGLYDTSLAALMTYERASNQWNFFTSSVTRLSINSNGSVLIGQTSSLYNAANRGVLEINGASTGVLGLNIGQAAASLIYWDNTNLSINNTKSGSMLFSTNNTERVKIDSSGNLGLQVGNQFYSMNQYTYTRQMGFNYPTTGFGAFIDATDFYTAGTYSNAVQMRISGTGSVGCRGSFLGGQTLDYAEYFEWADGNTANEDRIGSSVVLENGLIRLATSTDPKESIIGAVSATAGVILGSSPFEWAGKFLKDDFGRDITEEVTWLNWYDEEGNSQNYKINEVPSDVVVPADAETRTYKQPILNPAYKENAEYQDRGSRKEWACIGLMGQIRIKKGQPTGANWIKMKDISASVELWFVK